MGWLIFGDVLLWIAAIVLFILAAVTPSFVYFLIGLGCLVLAIVVLCIMVGGGSGSSVGFTDTFDFDFSND